MKKIIFFTIVCLSTLFSSAQCLADFTWLVSGNTVQLTNTSSGTNFNSWSFGDGGSSTATNPNYTYSTPGLYDICLYSYYADSMGNFCDDSVCYQVVIIDSMGGGCTIGASVYGSGSQIIGTNTSSGASSYEWTVFDYYTGVTLNNSLTTNLSYSPTYFGDFYVCLTAFDSMGLVCDTLCNIVTLVDTMSNPCNAAAGFTWSVTGNSVQFTNTSTGTNNNNWSFGDGGNSFATNPTHTYANPGTYTACLYSYYTDSMGVYCDDSICYSITVIDTMQTNCTTSAIVYSTGPEIFGTNSSTGASFYNWTVSDYNTGAYLTSATTTYLYYTPGYDGDFLVCLTAYQANGLVCDTVCNVVTVLDTMPNPCNATANFTWSISGNTVQFTNTSTGTNNNNWSFGDGGNSFATNPTHTYANPGTYTACLYSYYTDSMGVYCDDSICYSITVIDTIPPCNAAAGFTWSVTGNSVQFTNTSTGTNNNNWSFGDGGNSFATNPTHTYANPGTYTACLYSYYTDSMGVYCDDSICYSITVIDTMQTNCTTSAIVYSTGPEIFGTNSSTGASFYNWTVSDYNTGAYLTSATTTYLYYTPGYDGDFLVCLTAYQANGLVCDTVCNVVTVLDTMPNPCNATANFTWSISGNTVQFTNTSTGTNNNDWSFGDGGNSFATNPNHTYTNPGTYTVCLYSYYTDSMGVYCGDTVCYPITVIDTIPPCNATVGFNWSTNGNTIQFTNTSTGTNGNDWSFGDGGYSVATNPNHAYANPGTYTVCLYSYYTDSMGVYCGDTVCYPITVIDTIPPCNATVGFTWSTNGNAVQFTNTSIGTNNNEWYFGDGGYSVVTNPNHAYANPGTYTVCLYSYYTDSMGVYCGDTVCYPITVIDTIPPCNATASFTWSTNGNAVQFTNTSTGTNNNEWYFGDGGYSVATNPNHTYANPGTYTVCLYSYYTDSMGVYCDDSVCYTITVIDTMGAGCSVGANIYSNVNEIVGINTSTGASFFTWTITDYGSGAFVSSATTTDLSYYPNYTGNFWVCLTAHDSSGLVCDTVCDIVTAVYDSLDSTANVAVVTFNEFKLYPNPTNAILNLKFDHLPSNVHARIVDLIGREMIEVDVTSEVTEIQVADFPSGIYIVQLIDENNQIMGIHKFVRE